MKIYLKLFFLIWIFRCVITFQKKSFNNFRNIIPDPSNFYLIDSISISENEQFLITSFGPYILKNEEEKDYVTLSYYPDISFNSIDVHYQLIKINDNSYAKLVLFLDGSLYLFKFFSNPIQVKTFKIKSNVSNNYLFSLSKMNSCDFIVSSFDESNFIIYFLINKNNNDCINSVYEITENIYPHGKNIDQPDKGSFNCVYNSKFNTTHCAFYLYNDITYYSLKENKFEVILKTKEQDCCLIDFKFRKYTDEIYYTIFIDNNSKLYINHLLINENKIVQSEAKSIDFLDGFYEIKEINENTIFLLYIYYNDDPRFKFLQLGYFIDLQNLIFKITIVNENYKFVQMLSSSNYFILLSSEYSSEYFTRLLITQNLQKKNNDNRNLYEIEELFYYYFQRPTCHDIKLKISTNSYIHIGISKITDDENTLNYHLVIVKTPINGKLKYFFYNNYNSMDELENYIDEDSEEYLLANRVTYYSPNTINQDIIYFYIQLFEYEALPRVDGRLEKLLSGKSVPDSSFYSIPSELCKIEIQTIKCADTCEECIDLGNEGENKCTLCKKGYSLDDKGNCINIEEKIKSFLIDESNLDKNNIKIKMNDYEAIQTFDLISQMDITSGNYINIIGENITISKYKVPLEENENKNQPKIDLGECELNLKRQYNKILSEDLYITQITYYNHNSPKNNIKYKIFDKDNNELSLDICSNDTIIETYPISSEKAKEFNIDLYKDILNNLGENIFDPESDFYNNICFRYSMNKRDMTLRNRREHIFKNITFCDNNCKFLGLDENDNIKCECIGISQQKSSTKDLYFENSSLRPYKNMISNFNIVIMKCTKNLFKDLGNNISFYIIVSGLISEITLTVLYYRSFNNYNIKSNPPKKNSETQKININNKGDNQILNLNIPKDNKIQISNASLHSNNNKGINISSNSDRISFKIKEKKDKENEDENSSKDLNEMDYRDALKNDKRPFKIMFRDFLLEKQVFLVSFYSNSLLFTFHLRIISIIFNIHTFFFLNGLLCNDDFITERFNYKGKDNLSYLFKRSASISVYSSLIGIIFAKICLLLTSSDKNMRQLIKKINENPNDIKTKNDLIYELNSMKMKRKVYFVIIFLLEIIYFYYLLIFNFIYKFTQKIWVTSTFMTIFFNIIFTGVICLCVTAFRIISLKKEIWLLYAISGIGNDFF